MSCFRDKSPKPVTASLLIDAPLLANELPVSECLVDGPLALSLAKGSAAVAIDTLILLAHGAGADMRHDFMTQMAESLGAQGLNLVRFNFPYMRSNAIDGKRRPPDRAPKLLLDFRLHIAALNERFQPKRLILMGKSMGGRMAAMVAGDTTVSGVVCLGYPFVPPKGGEPRLEPIAQCKAPVLIIQGERDKFGARGQVETWLSPYHAELRWLTDGDHSFVPRKSSGTTLAANLAQAVFDSDSFIRSLHA